VSPSKPPLPDDVRLLRPRLDVPGIRGILRRLVNRVGRWWLEPLTRSIEERLHEEAAERHRVSVELTQRVDKFERLGLSTRVDALEGRSASLLSSVPSSNAGRKGGEWSNAGRCSSFHFQSAFRNDEAQLRERANWYLERLPEDPIFDVGCGTGSFLEECASLGRVACGVDMDESSVIICKKKGLSVELDDMMEALARVEPASLGGLVSIHVIEHLPVASIVEFLSAARSKLSPRRGRLIVEAPNPMTLSGLSGHFLDPTHVTVLHPELLDHLLERAGFAQRELHFLDPVPTEHRLRLFDGVENPSLPDALRYDLALVDELLYGPRTYCCIAQEAVS